MKKITLLFTILTALFVACENDSEDIALVINQGDYPVKEYYLERNPKVNVWGAGMDFIHEECLLADTELDYKYMEEEDTSTYDILFYTVKAYYYDENEDLQSNGCPAILLSTETEACQLGNGVSFFDSLTVVTEDMMALLANEPVMDYEQCISEESGFYDRDVLYSALESCIIGQSFRSDILVIPEGSTEHESQAVYLLKTADDAYVKFMVKEFKGEEPNDKQTLMRWQIISE